MKNDKFSKLGILTIAYLFLIVIFALADLDNMKSLTPNEWGDFFAGFFAPLAFLWLVFGYFQQGEELKQNTEALKLQAEELKNSVQQQILLNQLHNDERQSKHYMIEPILDIRSSDSEKSICKLPINEVIDPYEDEYIFWSYKLTITNCGNHSTKTIILYKGDNLSSVSYPKLILQPSEQFDIDISISELEINTLQNQDITHKLRIIFFDELGKIYERDFECTLHPINMFDDNHFIVCDYNATYHYLQKHPTSPTQS